MLQIGIPILLLVTRDDHALHDEQKRSRQGGGLLLLLQGIPFAGNAGDLRPFCT